MKPITKSSLTILVMLTKYLVAKDKRENIDSNDNNAE